MRLPTVIACVVLIASCKESVEVKTQKKGSSPAEYPRESKPTQQSDDSSAGTVDALPGETSSLPGSRSEDPSATPQKPNPNMPGNTTKPSLPAFCGNLRKTGTVKSAKVSYNTSGQLEYSSDKEMNRIPDFSYAGYRYGEVEPPVYPVVKTLAPIQGDNSAHIQKAIDEVSAMTADANGVRGAVLLQPGRYAINGSLRIKANGIVLRGSGDGADPSEDTILLGVGNTPHQRTIIVLGTAIESTFKPNGEAMEITDPFVQVGAMEVNVRKLTDIAVGDWVQIKHPSTAAWIDAVEGGGVIADDEWKPGSTDIVFNRRVTALKGNTIGFDAPIYNHLDRRLSVSTVSKLTPPQLIRESGVENLRIDIQTKGGEDENHAWDGVGIFGAEDSWARKITVLHFGQAGIYTRQATRITIDQSTAIEPVGIRTGERFYNFNAEAGSQLILIKNCHAKDGRHNFISNGVQSSSGIVFHNCTSDGQSASEGHRRWTTGMLFDSITEKGSGSISLFNRADYGTSHGWSAAHSVVWNYNGTVVIQKPPTAQNYVVSTNARTKTTSNPGSLGSIEIKAGTLSPPSLYVAQLCERLQK